MFSAVESFLFISSSGFLCFCHRVCSRTRKPQKVLISNFFEVLRLYLILSTFLSIPCAHGTTLSALPASPLESSSSSEEISDYEDVVVPEKKVCICGGSQSKEVHQEAEAG